LRDRLYTIESDDVLRKSYASATKRIEDESKNIEPDFHNSKRPSELPKIYIPFEYQDSDSDCGDQEDDDY
jgi:hypothetical protein